MNVFKKIIVISQQYSKRKVVLSLLKKHWHVLAYVCLAFFVRVITHKYYLYFIWDQGWDAFALKSIAEGQLKLTGPSTGLQGFFLGPLWLYLGIPGYWFSNGSPYGISLWYVFLSCLALPIFWKLSHMLFKKPLFAWTCALLLAFIPGSIRASVFVWNPLLAVPLLALGLFFLIKGRSSLKAALAGICCVAFILHSEFAYGIFVLVGLFVLFPWIRGKFRWIELLLACIVVGITFIPQGIFELRNNFIMTRSLTSAIGKEGIGWGQLLSTRPAALWDATAQLFFSGQEAWVFMLLVMPVLCYGSYVLLTRYKTLNLRQKDYPFQLVALISILPYIFYMFWRGNHGSFFDYYITSHFIPLVILFVYGLQELSTRWKNTSVKKIITPIHFVFLGIFMATSFSYLYNTVLAPENHAGLRVMDQATRTMFRWAREDGQNPATFITFTPNTQTEHYDYLASWYATKVDSVEIPLTVRLENVPVWYILIEPDLQNDEFRFSEAYEKATHLGVLARREKVEGLTIETWMYPEFAVERGFREKNTVPQNSIKR